MSRVKEAFKSVLIVLLIISGMVLTVKTWVYDPSMLPGDFYEKTGRLLSYIGIDISIPGAVTVETRRIHNTQEAARPIRCAIKLPDGRYGAEYDSTLVSQVYDKTKRLVGEAIGSGSEPVEVSQKEWRQALGHIGIYYDYLADIPMSAIAIWQNYEPSSHIKSSAQHIILAVDGETVGLYYTSGAKDRYMFSKTALNPDDLADVLTDYSANGCVFTFEDGTVDHDAMDELFLFEGQPVRLASSSRQQYDESGFTSLLKAFGMGLSSARYTQSDNTIVAVDRARTLTLSGRGDLVYSDSGEDKSGEMVIYVSKPKVEEIVETVRIITEQTAGPLSGDAEISLVRFEYDASKDEYVVAFDYNLNGIPVILSSLSNAATFRIRGGVLVYSHIQLRTFMFEDDTYRPMPIKTAIVLGKKGANCSLCYSERDTGGETDLDIGWYSR